MTVRRDKPRYQNASAPDIHQNSVTNGEFRLPPVTVARITKCLRKDGNDDRQPLVLNIRHKLVSCDLRSLEDIFLRWNKLPLQTAIGLSRPL